MLACWLQAESESENHNLCKKDLFPTEKQIFLQLDYRIFQLDRRLTWFFYQFCEVWVLQINLNNEFYSDLSGFSK